MPAQTITYEAEQDRPQYWDGLPHNRRALDGRNGDWRMSHTRVAKEFSNFTAAERYARRILGQRPGVPVDLRRLIDGRYETRVATVSRDALGRTWTDFCTWEATP